MTVGEVNRIGNDLRENKKNEHALNRLAAYRQTFYADMSTVQNACIQLAKKIEANSIVVSRFKRYNTIISKLERYPSMKLAQIQDIAGCRIIFEKLTSVYELVDKLSQLPDYSVKYEKDYIHEPKDNGYQCYHLILENNDSKRKVEIQIRTKEQHNWATLVEITDVIFKTNLKERSEPKDFCDALSILSKRNEEITIEENIQLMKFQEKKHFVQKLMNVFTKNIKNAENRWRTTNPNDSKKYFVIQVEENESFSIKSYVSRKKAESTFLETFINNEDRNNVLVYLMEPKFENLVLAYSNYVLIGNDIVLRFHSLIKELSMHCIKNKRFIKLINLYLELLHLFDLEIDWALAYMKQDSSGVNHSIKPPGIANSEFGRLMKVRVQTVLDGAKELDDFAEKKAIGYSTLLKTCQNIYGFIGEKKRSKKMEELKRLVNEESLST